METWYIRSGNYPYLEGVKASALCLTLPYPPVFWQGGDGYPTCPETPASCAPVGCFANAARLHTVFFNGTAAAFRSIALGTHWRVGAGFDSVVCTDGIITV